MRRNVRLTALLLVLVCAACGARMPGGENTPSAGEDRTVPATAVPAPERTGPGEPGESGEAEKHGGIEEPEAVDGGAEVPVSGGTAQALPETEGERAEDPGAETEGPEETEEIDYSGRYRDLQGTDEVYSELILSRQEEGGGLYDASIGLYRLTTLEGIAQVQEDGTLFFVGGPPKVQAVITIDGEQAAVEITVSEFEYIHPGDVYTFPDGKA